MARCVRAGVSYKRHRFKGGVCDAYSCNAKQKSNKPKDKKTKRRA